MKKLPITILLPESLVQQVDDARQTRSIPRGTFIRNLLFSYFDGELVLQSSQKILTPVNKLAAIELELSKPMLTKKAEKAIEKLRNRIEKQKVLEANAPDEQVYERVRQRIEALYEMVERIEAGENPDIVVPELAAPSEPEPLTEADLQPVEQRPATPNQPTPASVMDMDWE